jgi:hypothetical protein
MTIRRRSAVLAGVAAFVPALAGLVLTSTPAASAHPISTPPAGNSSAGTPMRPSPPLGLPKPSGAKPFHGPPGTASPWTPLKNLPPFKTPGTMLLESNGTVLVHDEPDNNKIAATNKWFKLTPDSKGSYIDGTWSKIASMPNNYAPLYFASAILPDGRMIVEGGEYLGAKAAWTNEGAIYNPVTNTWASVAPPPGWANIGDASSVVLPNGTFMLQQACQNCLTDPEASIDDALLNAKTMTWTVIPAIGKEDPNDEEGWTLEPSGQLLSVEVWALPQAQLFHPSTESWSFAGAMPPKGNPVNLFPVVEIGPQNEMPGGNTFVAGAGVSSQFPPAKCTTDAKTESALYHFKAGTAGTWTAGPVIKPIGGKEFATTDGPGATLPDGNVLFDASACVFQHADSLLPLPRELEHDYPDPGRAQRPEGHLVRHADAGPAERAGAVQRRPPQDARLYGRREAEGVVAAFDHIPEFDDAAPWEHLQPVRQAARRAGPGNRLR